MTLTADLFFSFRSPYSYLAVGRYRAMAEEYDLHIALRTVWPIAIRDPDILFTGNPAAPRYILADSYRTAQFLGIPFRWPRPDPIVQNLVTREIAEVRKRLHDLRQEIETIDRRPLPNLVPRLGDWFAAPTHLLNERDELVCELEALNVPD